MEYQIQPSPILRNSQNVFQFGVEKSWTPTLSFETNGDLAVTYAENKGHSFLIGDIAICWFRIATLTFTHSTAANGIKINGFPYVFQQSALQNIGFTAGSMVWRGITKAGFTEMIPTNQHLDTWAFIYGCGSGQNPTVIAAGDMPSGGNVEFKGFTIYQVRL